MYSLTVNIILGVLVVVLGWLLWLRHRQLKQARPLENIDRILKNLQQNFFTNRSEGKIQKVAGQLSDILINNLSSSKIIFFRKQRRSLDISYVYGLKNIRRPQFRIKLTPQLSENLISGDLIHHPRELLDHLGEDLRNMLKSEGFNVVFPVFWTDNLFGVYFIKTSLAVNHPLIMTFLLYLNQNLSAAYQIKRLESSRQMLEKQIKREHKNREKEAGKNSRIENSEENPGHLIEMFRYKKVDDLLERLFYKIKAGLKTDRLIFYSPPLQEGRDPVKFILGVNQNALQLNDHHYSSVLSKIKRNQVYGLDKLPSIPEMNELRENLKRLRLNNFSRFSLAENENGILFWAGPEQLGEAENRILSRLERIGQRALANASEFEKMEAKTYTDALTGLYNHRYFVKRLNEEIQRASRYKRRLGLMLFDIDDFKVFNDKFGHQWGDELLRVMGMTLSKSLRSVDIVSRYGGDEFCIILPEADRSTCAIFMERLRKSIADTDFRVRENGFEGRVTISIGAAIFPDDADNADRLIYSADMALLRSKAKGRNCSTCFTAELLEK